MDWVRVWLEVVTNSAPAVGPNLDWIPFPDPLDDSDGPFDGGCKQFAEQTDGKDITNQTNEVFGGSQTTRFFASEEKLI